MDRRADSSRWRSLAFSLGMSLLINLILCGALAHLSSTPPHVAAACLAVELDGVTPPPPPPPQPPLLKRLLPPPVVHPKPVEMNTPPTLIQKMQRWFNPAPPVAPPPATPEPDQPSLVPEPTPAPEQTATPPVATPDPPAPPHEKPAHAATPEQPPQLITAVQPPSVAPAPAAPTVGNGGNAASTPPVAIAVPGGGHGANATPGDGGGSHPAAPHPLTTDDGGTHNAGPGATSGSGDGGGTTVKTGGEHVTSPPTPERSAGDGGHGHGDGTGSGNGTGNGTPAPNGVSRGAQVTRQQRPDYPPSARDEGIEGIVILTVSLDATGKVTAVKHLRSSGDRRLDRAAERAVREWRYTPKLVDGEAMASTLRVEVKFELQ